MKKNLLISLKLLLYLTVITGIIYPVTMTLISGLIFPYQSKGSMIVSNEKIIGSEIIGQDFADNRYFTPRPSAISYNPLPTGASNQGPTNIILKDSVEKRKKKYIKVNGLSEDTHIPVDAVFASASGVDPHISVENVMLQSNKVANTRNFDENKRIKLRELINRLIEKPQFGIFGEQRINVLLLNIELDKI
ncbi:MAG: potassium-transporting ATPase subunit KdpC [Ignavibacteriae bacterium]|nr:MAG: potassium-transporting ATPase subunit KdpC [Ignavibacteriota bacterium]